MAILGLDHIQIAIPEGGEDKARSFYAELLGMTEVPKPATLSSSGCWFTAGTLNLHCGVDPEFREATKAHPALLVDDLDNARLRIVEAGFPVAQDKPIAGYRRFFTTDPFGNRLEILQAVS